VGRFEGARVAALKVSPAAEAWGRRFKIISSLLPQARAMIYRHIPATRATRARAGSGVIQRALLVARDAFGHVRTSWKT
jgi:hypothetical protein